MSCSGDKGPTRYGTHKGLSIISWTGAALSTAVVIVRYNGSSSISWESVYKISRSWVEVLIIMSYSETCICPDAISLMICKRNIRFCANLGKSATKTLTMIRHAFDQKTKRDRWRIESRACLSFSLTSRGCSQRILPGRPYSQIRMLLWCFTATAWKFAKTSPQTLATKEMAFASRQHTVSHFLFITESFTKSNTTVISHPPYFSVSPI
jgi:hypothetical protein